MEEQWQGTGKELEGRGKRSREREGRGRERQGMYCCNRSRAYMSSSIKDEVPMQTLMKKVPNHTLCTLMLILVWNLPSVVRLHFPLLLECSEPSCAPEGGFLT